MALDSYRPRSLDQVKNDSQLVDEIEQMDLDPDLKAKLREAKMNLEMEQIRLERQKKLNSFKLSFISTSLDATIFTNGAIKVQSKSKCFLLLD